MCSHLFSPLLTSSELFSHLLSWSQLLSARLTSSLLSALSNHLTFALAQTCSKNGSRRQSKQPLRFPKGRFDTEKLLHTASFETKKLLHRKAFTHRKLLHRSFYSAGLKHRTTFWKSPGVSEKLPFRRAGPKSHVFELFFSFGKLRMSNWNVTKHRACQSKQVWDTEHRMGFRAQLKHSWFSKTIWPQ